MPNHVHPIAVPTRPAAPAPPGGRAHTPLQPAPAGVPMFSGGDELYRTQYGNNNPYNLDSAKNWLDWSNLGSQAAFFEFTQKLCHFRTAHPALRPGAYLDGRDHDGNGLKNLIWLNAAGLELEDVARSNPAQNFLAFRLDGKEAGESVTSLCVAYNASEGTVVFTLPSKKTWLAVGDSATGLFRGPGQEAAISGPTYSLAPRSVAVLLEP